MKTISRYIMTLALLLTAVGGAWAQNVGIAEMTSDLKNTWTNDAAVLTATDLPGFVKVESDVAKAFSGELPQTGFTMIIYAFSEEGKTRYVSYQNGVFVEDHAEEYTHGTLKGFTFPIYYISESGIEVTWDPTTRTGTFTMPAFDVELTPVYAPAAKWATEGDVELLPTAAEGVIAGTTDAIIEEGTVATGQGTVMYFATTDATMTAEKAAAADGWLSTLPTAAGYDDAQTVYVWYYIQGADTPDGQEATAENTFNDSEICAEPIKVTVLSNKFDIQFNAANANTIEAGKATVKVGETAAEVKEGKLTGVKMGSKVTVTAKNGYKFRKAEGKKAEAPATPEGPTLAQTLTTANMTVKVYYIYTDMNNTCEFLSNGDGTYTFQSGTGLVGGNDQKAKALVVENGKLVFKQNFYETLSKLWNQVGFSVTFDTSENTYSIWKGSNETINATLSKVEVNGTQIALTQQ